MPFPIKQVKLKREFKYNFTFFNVFQHDKLQNRSISMTFRTDTQPILLFYSLSKLPKEVYRKGLQKWVFTVREQDSCDFYQDLYQRVGQNDEICGFFTFGA